MNWSILILVGLVALALVIFLVIRNVKDEKNFEEKIKHDYKKPREDEGDIEVEEKMK
jgi:flagellar biosynthesis/type III secretory pathway M-ring protein FliF/YscJ